MIPSNIQQQLNSLRRRERTLQLIWGAARLAAVVLALIFAACLIDYLVDSYQETPWGLRVVLLVGVLASAAICCVLFFGPLLHKLHDEELALWVEDNTPKLEHRLISAVQLNREGALVEGMSMELVGVVTREADQHADRMRFAAVADHQRLKRSALIVLPAAALLAVPFFVWPALSTVLLSRLFLADQAIERRVTLENITRPVWPMGEKVQVEVRVSGSREHEPGKLVIKQGLISDSYALESKDRDPRTGQAIYFAEVPPSTIDFKFNVYVGDGRLAENALVQFKAKPVVTHITASTKLPRYCDPRPGHGPYYVDQPRGDASGLPGSSVRIQATIPKFVEKVTLKLYGSASGDPAKTADTVFREFTMSLKSEKDKDTSDRDSGIYVFEQSFELREKETVYEIEAVDRYGFRNDPVPRRGVRQFAESPPDVALLPEQFPDRTGLLAEDDDLELDGLPVPVGGALRVAYTCAHPFGLGRASLKFRIIPKTRDSEKNLEAKWQTLPLREETGSDTDRFDPRRGVFMSSGNKDQVPFHAIESPDPAKLGRTVGGGNFLFQTAKLLVDDGGKIRNPDKGDQIEYYVEVYPDLDPNAIVSRPSGRSGSRMKTFVSDLELILWLNDHMSEESRIRNIGTQQQNVFGKKK